MHNTNKPVQLHSGTTDLKFSCAFIIFNILCLLGETAVSSETWLPVAGPNELIFQDSDRNLHTSSRRSPLVGFMLQKSIKGATWLSGRVLDSRLRGHRFDPHRCHCVVSLTRHIYPCLVLDQSRH